MDDQNNQKLKMFMEDTGIKDEYEAMLTILKSFLKIYEKGDAKKWERLEDE